MIQAIDGAVAAESGNVLRYRSDLVASNDAECRKCDSVNPVVLLVLELDLAMRLGVASVANAHVESPRVERKCQSKRIWTRVLHRDEHPRRQFGAQAIDTVLVVENQELLHDTVLFVENRHIVFLEGYVNATKGGKGVPPLYESSGLAQPRRLSDDHVLSQGRNPFLLPFVIHVYHSLSSVL